MGMQYATITDVQALWRPFHDNAEKARCETWLPVICARLRAEAAKVGKDLDALVTADEDLAQVAKSVTVDVVARTLMASTDGEPATQLTQSALGYSQTVSYLSPGGGLFIKDSELKALGLKRQRAGVIDFYEQSLEQRDQHLADGT